VKPAVKKAAPAAPKLEAAAAAQPRAKLSYKDQRDLDRLPGEIERLEQEMAAIEEALHDPALYAKNPDRFAKLTADLNAKRAEKDAAEERWLEVAEMSEALAKA